MLGGVLSRHTVISTHTLTWSVTSLSPLTLGTVSISTHTLTWSVTLPPLPLCLSFQISTHTLTWSVTRLILTPLTIILYFNSHAHVERDYSGFATGTNYQDFNSHAHVERDSRSKIVPITPVYFNSHAHVERDVLDTLEKSAETEFQLTRSRGA